MAMVVDKSNLVLARKIANLLTGYLSWNARYVNNLRAAIDGKQEETLRMWLSASRVFSKWYRERMLSIHHERANVRLETVFAEYFQSRSHFKASSNRAHFSTLKTLFQLHPEVYEALTDRDWSAMKQVVSSISQKIEATHDTEFIQPILRRHLFSFADKVASTIRTDPARRQHLLRLRALGAVAHTAMLRVPTLSRLEINNIEEIVTNTVSRLEWDREVNGLLGGEEYRRHLPTMSLMEFFDPPVYSVTCSVSIPKKSVDWIVRLGPEMTGWVLEWIDSRVPYDENELLFHISGATHRKKQLTPTIARKLFSEIMRRAGVSVRHVTQSSMLFGGIVDYLRKGACYYDLAEKTQINGKGVSVERIASVDRQLSAHAGALDDFIIEL